MSTGIPATCFSSSCGLCDICCKDSISKRNDKQQREQRTKDLYKILGPQKLSTLHNEYAGNLKQWCRERGYKGSNDIGWARTTMNLGEDKYILSTRNKAVCDDPFCKVIYLNMHEHLRKSFYHSIPLYIRNKKFEEDKFKLCGPCITKYIH